MTRAILVWLFAAVGGSVGSTTAVLVAAIAVVRPLPPSDVLFLLGIAGLARVYTAVGAALLFPLDRALRRSPLGALARLGLFLACAVVVGAAVLTATLRPPDPTWTVLLGGGYALLTALS